VKVAGGVVDVYRRTKRNGQEDCRWVRPTTEFGAVLYAEAQKVPGLIFIFLLVFG